MKKIIFFITIFYICVTSAFAVPQPENYPLDRKITYHVLQQDIRSALRDISTQVGIPVVVASNVKGKVAAGEYKGTARDVMNMLVADLNLHWYYDGRSVQVTTVQDAVMHVVRLNTFTFDALDNALKMIYLDTKEFPLRYDAHNNMVVVYGPPKFVATVEVVAHYLTMRAKDKPNVLRGG